MVEVIANNTYFQSHYPFLKEKQKLVEEFLDVINLYELEEAILEGYKMGINPLPKLRKLIKEKWNKCPVKVIFTFDMPNLPDPQENEIEIYINAHANEDNQIEDLDIIVI